MFATVYARDPSVAYLQAGEVSFSSFSTFCCRLPFQETPNILLCHLRSAASSLIVNVTVKGDTILQWSATTRRGWSKYCRHTLRSVGSASGNANRRPPSSLCEANRSSCEYRRGTWPSLSNACLSDWSSGTRVTSPSEADAGLVWAEVMKMYSISSITCQRQHNEMPSLRYTDA